MQIQYGIIIAFWVPFDFSSIFTVFLDGERKNTLNYVLLNDYVHNPW